MTVDYRTLNRQTKKDIYPLLCIDNLLDKLSRARFLSAIDLASGYHQIKLADDACEKTAFVTCYGLFKYTILPLGLCNALSIFQHLMNVIMSGYMDDFILVYLANILVYSNNAEVHKAHLHKGSDRLCEHKLQAKLKKCKFVKPYVKYLGHVVGFGELHVDLDKVAAVLEWEPPQDIKGVQ